MRTRWGRRTIGLSEKDKDILGIVNSWDAPRREWAFQEIHRIEIEVPPRPPILHALSHKSSRSIKCGRHCSPMVKTLGATIRLLMAPQCRRRWSACAHSMTRMRCAGSWTRWASRGERPHCWPPGEATAGMRRGLGGGSALHTSQYDPTTLSNMYHPQRCPGEIQATMMTEKDNMPDTCQARLSNLA